MADEKEKFEDEVLEDEEDDGKGSDVRSEEDIEHDVHGAYGKNSRVNFRRLTRFFLMFLTILVLGFIASAVWFWYEDSQNKKAVDAQYQKYQDFEDRYIEAMTADTWGGATPQETLDMFIAALRAEDIELAAKYFALDDNTEAETYLTRKKWEDALAAAKSEGRLKEIADILSKAKPDPDASIGENHYVFSAKKDGEWITDVDLYFNPHSNIWKIESI